MKNMSEDRTSENLQMKRIIQILSEIYKTEKTTEAVIE